MLSNENTGKLYDHKMDYRFKTSFKINVYVNQFFEVGAYKFL